LLGECGRFGLTPLDGVIIVRAEKYCSYIIIACRRC